MSKVHLKTHGQQNSFKCDQFGQEFYLNWRLTKHKERHEKNLKYCHYFNNDMTCPYEENGCMCAVQCSFQEKCRHKLCQFRHPKKKIQTYLESSRNEKDEEPANEEIVEEMNDEKGNEPADEESVKEMNDNTTEFEEDSEVECCNYCSKVFNDIDDLIDHFGITGHNLLENDQTSSYLKFETQVNM